MNENTDKNLITYADRLVYAMTLKGIDQSELARKVGIKPQSIQYLCKKGTKSTYTTKISEILGIEAKWLETGEREKSPSIIKIDTIFLENNVSEINNHQGEVPLISRVSAGLWCESVDNYSVDDVEMWLPCPAPFGKHTYALRVSCDSMTSLIPGAKSYPHGSIIYVDPDVQVTNGRRVIAKLIDDDEVTFKTYKEDAGKKWLMPINAQYDKILIDDSMAICGVIIAKYEPE